jgi:hypothetical protein
MLGHGRLRRYANTQHSGPPSISLTAGKNAFLFVELVLSTATTVSMSVTWLDVAAPPAAEFSGYRGKLAGNWQRNLAQGRTLDLATWITFEQTETIRWIAI